MNKKVTTIMYYVKLALARKSASQKVNQGNFIVASMTGNLAFPTPDPALASFQTTITALQNASAAAEGGGAEEKNNLKTAVANYDIMATRLGLYVQSIADLSPADSGTLITSAGMETRKTPEKNPLPTQSQLVARFTDISFTIKLLIKGGKYAKFFNVYQTLTPEDPASFELIQQTSRRSIVISGLTTGVRYTFKVVPHGTAGVGVASNVASQLAA